MGCCGKHKKAAAAGTVNVAAAPETGLYPHTGCVLCAEKHLSTAYALAGEAGYVPVNRQRIIGELTAAALHLFKEHAEMAERVRGMRHAIQTRREADVNWNPLLAEIDELARKSLEEA